MVEPCGSPELRPVSMRPAPSGYGEAAILTDCEYFEGGNLQLPDVTLIAIDSVAHALTRRALEDTRMQVEPASTIVWSDSPDAVPTGATWVKCDPLLSLESVAEVLWWRVPQLVTTSHYLLVQWDGWVLDHKEWKPEFLEYDYLGAPWWYRDGLNVGNGGFCLRSTRLAKYLVSHSSDFPIKLPEDDVLCRRYRRELEGRGFRWAADELAWHFSFEFTRAYPRSFGFHGYLNWPNVLPSDAIQERIDLSSEYVRQRLPRLQKIRGL